MADRNIIYPLTNVCITRCDVVDAIKCLSVGSAPGIDDLPAVFFKKCSNQLSVPLQSIFQKSLVQEKLPSQWKVGKIVPIFKNKGSRSDPKNYRPVSLTSISCKIMERILKKHMINHLLGNNLLHPGQHGFLSGKSTQTQILECFNDWTDAIDQNKCIDVVYLDISKAFDTVSHEKLLFKMKRFGFCGPLLNWVENFLSVRSQFVQVNKDSSLKTNVTSCKQKAQLSGTECS